MKKYLFYIVTLVIGLFLGRLLFGTSEKNKTHEHSEMKTQQWTCSMHPQILTSEPGNCPICGMDLIPVESAAYNEPMSKNEFSLTKNAMALANIETTVIEKGTENSSTLILSGKIKENEKATAVQTSYFNGRIEKLYVNSTGETVKKGQLLALIYSPELVSAQEELLTALSLKKSQPELYNAVKSKLKIWKLSESQIHKIETTKQPLINFPIYTNVSGIVTEKLIEEGSTVKEGMPLLKLSNLSSVWAEFDVYEKQIPTVKIGDVITVSTNANPSNQFKAKIVFIDPVLNNSTRTTTARVELSNKNGVLKPGMFVQGVLNTTFSNTNTPILIPKSAVLWTGKRSVVYLKKKTDMPVFEMQEVTLGNETATFYEILNGLHEGDEIVTNGTFTVDAAAQLQGKKSMMNADQQKNTIDVEFKNQLRNSYNKYIDLKNYLVKNDSLNVQKTAKLLVESLSEINMKLLDENEHQKWMSLQQNLKKYATGIASKEKLRDQRNDFMLLSNNFITTIKLFGVNTKVYQQFCPMANNNNGAFWLSENEEILNPYYGDAMLHCGSVEEIYEN